jgi:phosphopentomutase
MRWSRAIVIVLDGVGIGEAPDAAVYGDAGSHSLANTARAVGGLKVPPLTDLGLGCIAEIAGAPPVPCPAAGYGKLCPRSPGKDSITGHWELMGVHLDHPLPTYPNGFPPELIQEFVRRTGRRVLGNRSASGTAILAELGNEHWRTGDLIVYTSADSVFQIAAHEDRVPVAEQYRICQVARDLLRGEHGVGRVIARPFAGSPGAFVRTAGRRDFSLPPPSETLLDHLTATGKTVVTVGKIDDMFSSRGITRTRHATTNSASIQAMLASLDETFEGLLLVNLVEFDMIHGHRNDPAGYARALAEFDACLPELQTRMQPWDLAMIVADHGVDPTTPGTDHSREYVPLLVFGPALQSGCDLGTRETFSDVAATIAEMLGTCPPRWGKSFLNQLDRAGRPNG